LENLHQAIYETLSSDPELTALVPIEQIRRGWNEPVSFPTVRFSLSEKKPIGDDLDNGEIAEFSHGCPPLCGKNSPLNS